jgi:hypothetical protein
MAMRGGRKDDVFMNNPWLKKNPFMSMWLSAAHSAANVARGAVAAEAKRQSTTAITKGMGDVLGAWGAFETPRATKRKKKSRFPGV